VCGGIAFGNFSNEPSTPRSKAPGQRYHVCWQELEQEVSEETALERDAAQKEEKAHQMEDELRRLEQQHERDVKEYRSALTRCLRPACQLS